MSGMVITAGPDQSDVSFDDLLNVLGITAMSVEDAVMFAGTMPGIVGMLTGLHNWLGQVIDTLAPTPDKPKRGRPSKADIRARNGAIMEPSPAGIPGYRGIRSASIRLSRRSPPVILK